MKKILALAVVALASVCASAQNFYVGGQAGFWHESNSSKVTNTLTILPEVGYNLNDSWAIGTTLGYEYNHLCGAGISGHIFQFNPYARWTFFKSSNNLVNLFVDGGAGVGAGWTHYSGGDDSKTACVWNIGLKPGVALNLTDRFSVVAHLGLLGYEGANDAAKSAGYKDQGGLLLNGNNIKLGFYYHF